jgi:hypothetical protein
MAKHDATEQPRKKADRVGGECRQRPRNRIEAGKENLIEDECRSRPVKEEIVPFDRRTHHAGHSDQDITAALGFPGAADNLELRWHVCLPACLFCRQATESGGGAPRV